MKRLLYVLFVIFAGGPLVAAIELRICDPNTLETLYLPAITVGQDPNTGQAFTLPDLMTGMRVSVVVSADANDLWSGGLFIQGGDRARGRLTARPGDVNEAQWAGSCLPAAGAGAYVLGWQDSHLWGFDCYTDDLERQAGDWFVLDYIALAPGPCTLGFYDHDASWTVPDPNLSWDFQHTRTRDLNGDKIVNFGDFNLFAAAWNQPADAGDPNCRQAADFSGNGDLGLEDVIMFADFWLWGAPGWTPAAPPAAVEPPVEPNIVYDVTYSLVCDPNALPFTDPNSLSDANSLSDITLQVGDSVVIYIDKTSTTDAVRIFNVDVCVSDPNLGVIDRTGGTAEILIWPRMDTFDYIGPPEQGEGIGFFAAHLDAIADGDMACLVYTAAGPGTVTLEMVNHTAAPPVRLEPMIIHQVMPVVDMLQQAYTDSPDLQQSVPKSEWDAFIESVEESTTTTK